MYECSSFRGNQMLIAITRIFFRFSNMNYVSRTIDLCAALSWLRDCWLNLKTQCSNSFELKEISAHFRCYVLGRESNKIESCFTPYDSYHFFRLIKIATNMKQWTNEMNFSSLFFSMNRLDKTVRTNVDHDIDWKAKVRVTQLKTYIWFWFKTNQHFSNPKWHQFTAAWWSRSKWRFWYFCCKTWATK